MKKTKIRAGLIPYIISDGQVIMLFMTPSKEQFGGSLPQIAKGVVDKEDIDYETAAVREAEEELGLVQSNMKSSPVFLGKFLKTMHIYIVEVINTECFQPPHHETKSTHWLTYERYVNEGRNLQLPIVKAALNRIQYIHSLRAK